MIITKGLGSGLLITWGYGGGTIYYFPFCTSTSPYGGAVDVAVISVAAGVTASKSAFTTAGSPLMVTATPYAASSLSVEQVSTESVPLDIPFSSTGDIASDEDDPYTIAPRKCA